MKRILSIILTILVLTTVGQTSGGSSAGGRKGNSTLKFDNAVWDFGQIREQDGEVSHKFGFVNNGKTPIVIEEVSVSCGCTTPKYSKAPVMPGARGEIEISFDPTGRPGVFLKDITVLSGGGTNYDKIQVTGNVAARPRTVEDDYPVALFSGVRLTASYINFEYVWQGRAKSMVVGYVNTSKKPVELKAAPAGDKSYFKVSPPREPVCAGCRGEITITYDLTQTQAWGLQSDEVNLTIDGRRVENPLSVSAICVDNFDGVSMELAPRSKLNSLFYHFGGVEKGAPMTKEFTLGNEGKTPLEVRFVKCGKGVTTTLKEGVKVAPGKSITFNVSLSSQEVITGRVIGSMTMIVNDPVRPMREVRLVANIK